MKRLFFILLLSCCPLFAGGKTYVISGAKWNVYCNGKNLGEYADYVVNKTNPDISTVVALAPAFVEVALTEQGWQAQKMYDDAVALNIPLSQKVVDAFNADCDQHKKEEAQRAWDKAISN